MQAIKELKPDILAKIIGEEENIEQIKKESFKLQRKLSSSKSDFANKLLFKFITADENTPLPVLPMYISKGLSWLSVKLNGGAK
jgi:hypothetical protein